MLDPSQSPISMIIGRSDVQSWHKVNAKVYPIVAKQVQFRITRTPDPELAEIPYPVGLRNCLIRRNVYDRGQAVAPFEDQVDVLGNLVSRYIKDWDAHRAADDNFTTFWKSAPQPDPGAVVGLYLDCRSAAGAPQVVDKIYLDPVYSGQHLNLYYSNDDTVGTRSLSPVTVAPTGSVNVEWASGLGLSDIATGGNQSTYQVPLNVGSNSLQDSWMGVEWVPSFSSSQAALPLNPVLIRVVAAEDGVHRPELSYDPATKTFLLRLISGTDVVSFRTDPISADWNAEEPLRIAAGWSYRPDRVFIKVVNQVGTVLAWLSDEPTGLPVTASMSGVLGFSNFRGRIKNAILKLEGFGSAEAFLSDPTLYCDPDPVVRDESGQLPSTSLDNAIYAAPFVSREHGSGGSDETHFSDKIWTPIWRDYTAVKGFLHLPRPQAMKYLKLEFTNLTEEPYPIFASGIETRYKVFPVSAVQQSSIGPRLYTGEGGFLGLGTFISMNGTRSVNWLNPRSVLEAIGSVLGPQTPPVIINTGTPYITTSLPGQGSQLVEESRRVEAASSYVYSRETLQPYVLAADQYNTIIKAEGLQALQPFVTIPWEEIERANPGAVTKVKSTGTVPLRGSDWWIYPGQQLKIPASVMTRLTDTATVTERKLTLESRVRFNSVSAHRYDYRTVKRDAAIAYFAGVREVQPYTSSYIAGEDKPVFAFPIYDPLQWSFEDQVYQTRDEKTGEPLGPIASLGGPGAVFKTIQTQSDFSRLRISFSDTGTLTSNALWAREGGDELSPNFAILPTSIPAGNWSDLSAVWSDDETVWGSSFGVIRSALNAERRFRGNRVLSFSRDADISEVVNPSSGVEAGIALTQYTNMVPQSRARVRLTYFKPEENTNLIRLRLSRAADNTIIHTETFTPQVGSWQDHYSEFVVLPETLSNGSFGFGDLTGWTPAGSATWVQDNTVGRTGVGSAKVVKDSAAGSQTIETEKMLFFASQELRCTAWMSWSGSSLAEGAEGVLKVQAVYYQDDQVVSTVDAEELTVEAPDGDSEGWVMIGGSVPAGVVATHVAFRVVISDGVTGTFWVDDVVADVPGAARQTYTLSLTVVGNDKDTLLVSDLVTEVAPIRYFVQLGGPGSYLHEVTDLRHRSGETVVTSPTPVNQFSLRTVMVSPKARAFGCQATPLYLK